jgi:hypothetical protein
MIHLPQNSFSVLRSLQILLFLTSTLYSSPRLGTCDGECQSGKGKFFYDKSMDVYEGSFLNGFFHGYGVLKLHRGKTPNEKIFDIYEGMFEKDMMSGEGIFMFANGDILSGTFSENKLNGVGIARNGSIEKNVGYIYSGQFQRNRFHGYGIYKYPDGSFYAGEFAEGKMTGLGLVKHGNIFTFIDGYDRQGNPEKSMIYEWKKNTFLRKDSNQKKILAVLTQEFFLYGGDLEEDVLSGVGFSIFNSDKLYYGEWSENKKNGTGIYLHNNGILYIGLFKDNRLHGLGAKYDRDGDLIYLGNWENGVRKN